MKTYYYYASQEFERFEESQEPSDLSYTITEGMLRVATEQNAIGEPPYTLLVPRDCIWQVLQWNLPKPLFRIIATEGKSYENSEPIDCIIIQFANSEVQIFYKRLRTCMPEIFDFMNMPPSRSI